MPELNTIAQKVMKKYSIPYADVYSWIMQKCGGGKPYASCPLCDNEPWKNPGAPVSWRQSHRGCAVFAKSSFVLLWPDHSTSAGVADEFECMCGCVPYQAGAHCGYHYTSEGYDYIVDFLGPIYRSQLGL